MYGYPKVQISGYFLSKIALHMLESEYKREVEGLVLTFSSQSTKIKTCCWTTINRNILEPTKKIYLISKDKVEAMTKQKEDHNHDKIKFYTHQLGDLQTGEQ